MTDLTIETHGVTLELCPERAAYRPDTDEVLVADVHLGKAATFRRAGRPIPKGTTKRELVRLDALLARKGSSRLTILGDLFHADVDAESPTARTFRQWLECRESIEVVLVRGNHDRHARGLIEELGLRAEEEPFSAGALSYRHHPGGSDPFIAGHVHPGARMDDGSDRLKLPVFWDRSDGLVLPAFGEFTGLQVIRPETQDRVAAVTPTGVVEVPGALLAAR